MTRTLNPVRFGLNPRGVPYDVLVAQIRAAEAAGFDTVTFSDRPPEDNLEGWTLASVVGALTSRVILTHSTLNVPFRNPALLAKMASSLDFITGGRVELTLGAGGQEGHFRSYGVYFGSPGERFADLKDAVAIMRGLWKGGPFSYQGRLFSVENAEAPPQPVHGAIPIIIGAGGPRMLRYTGAEADGWIKNGGWPESMDQYRGLLQQVEEGAAAAGRDPLTIRRVLNGTGYVGEGQPPGSDAQPPPGGQGGLIGPAELILQTVDEYASAGVDTFHLRFAGPEAMEQIHRFGEEVIAPLRRSQ